MGCRIGMATEVKARVKELVEEELVPAKHELTILRSRLNYDQANLLEQQFRRACGPQCDGQAGGSRVPGNVWCVYRLDW